MPEETLLGCVLRLCTGAFDLCPPLPAGASVPEEETRLADVSVVEAFRLERHNLTLSLIRLVCCVPLLYHIYELAATSRTLILTDRQLLVDALCATAVAPRV